MCPLAPCHQMIGRRVDEALIEAGSRQGPKQVSLQRVSPSDRRPAGTGRSTASWTRSTPCFAEMTSSHPNIILLALGRPRDLRRPVGLDGTTKTGTDEALPNDETVCVGFDISQRVDRCWSWWISPTRARSTSHRGLCMRASGGISGSVERRIIRS